MRGHDYSRLRILAFVPFHRAAHIGAVDRSPGDALRHPFRPASSEQLQRDLSLSGIENGMDRRKKPNFFGLQKPYDKTRKLNLSGTHGDGDKIVGSLGGPDIKSPIMKLAIEREVHAGVFEDPNHPCFKKLRHLSYFEAHQVSEKAMKNIIKISPYLLEFDLPECGTLTDDVLQVLREHCKMLTVVKIDCQKVENLEEVVELAKTLGPRLRKLALQNAKPLSNARLASICSACPKLHDLELRGCGEINDDGLQEVARFCSNLQTFACTGIGWGQSIQYQENITGIGVAAVLSAIKPKNGRIVSSLHKLDLETTNLNNDDLKLIAKNVGRLQVLWLTTTKVTSEGIGHLAASRDLQDSLEELWIGYNSSIDDDVFQHVKDFKELKLLQLNSTSVTRDGLFQFADQRPQTVTHLYCGTCSGLGDGDDVAKMLAQKCPQLEVVHLQDLSGLTDNGVIALSSKLHRLQSIHLKFCSEVSEVALKHLLRNHPDVEISGYNAETKYKPDDIEEWRKKVKTTLKYKLQEGINSIADIYGWSR